MNYLKLIKYLKNTAFFALILIFLNSCGVNPFERKDPIEPEARKRARQNVLDGKGISGGMFGKGDSNTNFEFATSNPLWRASLDTIDFMPLASANYSGGIIITDWYSEGGGSENQSLKITVRFLSNEIRADAVDVTIFEKICSMNNCKTNKVKSKLEKELKLAILKKATLFEKDAGKRYFDEKGKNRKGSKKDK